MNTRVNPRRNTALEEVDAYVRDHHTLELSRFLEFPEAGEADEVSTLDLYMFIPSSFGAGPGNWPAENLYRQSKVAVRLRAKAIRLADLADLDEPRNPAQLLLARIEQRARGEHCSGLVPLARIYGAEIADVLRDEVHAIAHALDSGALAAEVLAETSALCESTDAVLQALDRVRRQAMKYQAALEPGLLSTLTFAEEYSAALIDELLSRLVLDVERAEVLHDGRGSALKFKLIITRTLEDLSVFRRQRGFVTPEVGRPELYGYRLGLLKKELQQSLYVDTRPSSRDPFVSNSAAMVAAALAATWALLAQVPLLTGTIWSWKGLMFSIGAILAYVLKDRIKDIVKRRLVKRWKHWDHDKRILGSPLAAVGWGSFHGHARERVRWMGVDDVPSAVREVRRFHRTVRSAGADLERVLHYRRQVRLGVEDPPPPSGSGLQEILRIRLANLLRRLDDPEDKVRFYSRREMRFVARDVPRVYHINLVCILTESDGRRFATKFRAVVNQREVVRLEHVGRRPLPAE